MLYVADVPSPAEIRKFYENYSDFKAYQKRNSSYFRRLLRLAVDPYIRILRSSGGLSGEKLLDIGCSYGDFLKLAKQAGADASGVEIDQKAREHLAAMGMRCAETVPDDGSYSIVSALQLLEHLTAPRSLISQIAKALKNDGRFLFAIPNGEDAEIVGKGWVGFRVDFEHFNYFTLKTLSEALTVNGLFIEAHWRCSQAAVSRSEGVKKSKSLISIAGDILRKARSVPGDDKVGNFVIIALARKAQT